MNKDFLEDFIRSYMIPMLMILLVLLTVCLIYTRLRYVYLSSKKRKFLPQISDTLADLIFSGYQGDLLQVEINKFKSDFPYHKKWFRRLLLSSISDLSLNLKGDLISQVREIYMSFELHKFSVKLIKSSCWYTKCTGIYHFQALNFVKGRKFVTPYISSKNKILRSNAFIADLYLSTEPLDFLVDYAYPLSSVNEYKVIDVLYIKKEQIPSNIDHWLEAKNESIINLGLKIMMLYNYTDAKEKIISLLNNKNVSIRQNAILSIKELFLIDAEEILHWRFDKEENELKIEILKSLAVIGSKSTTSFIKRNIFRNDLIQDVKMELLRCLKSIDEACFEIRFSDDMVIDRMKSHLNSSYL
jgi:hypothetical protein